MSSGNHCPICGSPDYEVYGLGISSVRHPEHGEHDVPLIAGCFTCGHQEDVRPNTWRNPKRVQKYHIDTFMEVLQTSLRQAFLVGRQS